MANDPRGHRGPVPAGPAAPQHKGYDDDEPYLSDDPGRYRPPLPVPPEAEAEAEDKPEGEG